MLLCFVCAHLLSCVRLFVAPKGSFICQAPLSMGFSRQEYWSGLPFPPPGGLPDARIKSASHMSPNLAGGFFSNEPPVRSAHECKPELVA